MRTVLLVTVLLAIGVTALVRAVISSFNQTCEVCVTYQGRTICREAVGSERDEAVRIARERACEFLTSAAEAKRDCLELEPDSIRCEQE